MSGLASSDKQVDKALRAMKRRADKILQARPAYGEMVDFYLTVFGTQIEWRNRLAVHPEKVDADRRSQCLSQGKPLIECFDPGIESKSLLELWTEMKAVFGRGNDVLRQAVDKIEKAEDAGDFTPASWLLDQRPSRLELVADAAGRLGVDQSMLASLTRAATFPHWELVAQAWLPDGRLDEWKRSHCPTCGGVAGLIEMRKDAGGGEDVTASIRSWGHCAFCGSRWEVPSLKCPACESTKPGDSKYYFSADEPEFRIDFCKSCNHYIKVVDADKIGGRVHVGLELLTTAHLDAIAQDKNLKPLEVCA